MDEDNATAVIGAKETVISFYQFSLFVVFGSFCRFFIVFWVFVCRLVQDPHEPVIEGEQYFLEGVIVEGMYCFFLVFVVAVELEGFAGGVFVKEFGVVFDQPLCSAVAVEGDDVLLGEQ